MLYKLVLTFESVGRTSVSCYNSNGYFLSFFVMSLKVVLTFISEGRNPKVCALPNESYRQSLISSGAVRLPLHL